MSVRARSLTGRDPWATVALVLLQAWLGGELVYAHGAGVAPAGQGQQPAGKAQKASVWLYRKVMGTDPAVGAKSDSDMK